VNTPAWAALQAEAQVALLCAVRLAPTTLTSPFLGGPLVPAPVRAGLALGLGAAAGLLLPAAPLRSAGGLAAAGVAELATGLVLAFLASVPVDAARAAGRLADTVRGVTLTELHVAPIRQRESAAGDLLAQWVVVLAAWGGAERLLVRALLEGFAALPPGAAIDPAAGRELVLTGAAALVSSAVALAAPVAAGVLAAELAVALATRLSPALGVAQLAAPARAAVGLLALAGAASAAAGRLVALVALPVAAPATLAALPRGLGALGSAP
jgi:type III secretory pathway component EscT